METDTMGFNVEFNWILKIKDEEQLKGIREGEKRTFFKDHHRIYPIGINIMLCDKDCNCLGYIKVLKITTQERMEIEARIEKLFEEETKQVISDTLRDMYG
ncbi:hypothetical protein GF345_05950 [Candidatus Woesearchaeota archaeon]|nr:hypothetical protein [Candidatus Woesearchaeota archaeon]